jgi:hypothetical protein
VEKKLDEAQLKGKSSETALISRILEQENRMLAKAEEKSAQAKAARASADDAVVQQTKAAAQAQEDAKAASADEANKVEKVQKFDQELKKVEDQSEPVEKALNEIKAVSELFPLS